MKIGVGWPKGDRDIPVAAGSSFVTSISEVQRVKLSRSNCMMSVESLYDSSDKVSNSAIASSKACLAR